MCAPTGSGACIRFGRSPFASWSAGSRATASCGRRGWVASTRYWSNDRGIPKPTHANRQEERHEPGNRVADAGTYPDRSRSYDGPVEDLWALWTTKEGLEWWWGPEGFRVKVHELELRVGGALIYDMIADAPEQIEYMKQSGMATSPGTHETFTETEPLRAVEILHVIDFIPGLEPFDNRIRMEFFSEGGRAGMAVTVEPHPDPWTRMSIQGFESQLTKVPALVL